MTRPNLTLTRPSWSHRLTSGRVALVCAVLALTVSLGVPVEAAKLINGKNLKNNSVTGKKIKNSSLTGVDIKNNTVRGSDVKESTLKGVMMDGDVAAYGDASSVDIDDFTSAAFTPLVSTSFTAPSDGFLYITGSLSAEDDGTLGGIGRLLYRLRLDANSLTGQAFAHELHYASSGAGDSGAVTGVVPVTAGPHTVHLDGREIGTGSYIVGREISVLFVESGAGFTPPAKISSRVAPQ